jgi:hypothetical protein
MTKIYFKKITTIPIDAYESIIIYENSIGIDHGTAYIKKNRGRFPRKKIARYLK